MNNLFPIHHTRAGRFPPIYRPALFLFCFFAGISCWFIPVGLASGGLTQDSPLYSDRVSTLRAKSSAHARYVTELLAELGESSKTNPTPSERLSEEFRAEKVPFSDNFDKGFIEPQTMDLPKVDSVNSEEKVSNEVQSLDFDRSDYEESSTQDGSDRELYASLYHGDTELRRTGVYLGPFFGLSFSADSAVRDDSNHQQYDSESGYFVGFRIGNDFGPTKIEADYSYKSHNIESENSSGDVSVNSFMGRFIVEKEAGERFDFRAGLGMGLAMVEKNLDNKSFQGNGFCYDFLLGFSVRIMENWSILGDYRYYLTAAHKNYDRVQGHLYEISANFDL